MPTDFRSEMTAWREVMRLRKGTIFFFEALVVLLIAIFLVMVWEYQLFSAQVSQLTGQVEVIAEINEGLPEDELTRIQVELEALPEVSDVDYWSAERVVDYIDQRIFSGYQAFLQKYQLDVPVKPLFRMTVSELSAKIELEQVLQDRFDQQLFVIDAKVVSEGQSFASQFIDSLSRSTQLFQVLMILSLLVVLALSVYVTAFLLSERSKGFHLTQILHWTLPYTFWPAFLVSVGLSVLVTVLGMLLAGAFLGHFLVTLSALLLGTFVFVDLILVWFGRYIVTKWSLR